MIKEDIKDGFPKVEDQIFEDGNSDLEDILNRGLIVVPDKADQSFSKGLYSSPMT